ncbi:MAG: hypothetical protein M5U28_51765 [Sandaracinaceae bacterium]|nr:hypothetical protein [Sandaracinaceae bacterium]
MRAIASLSALLALACSAPSSAADAGADSGAACAPPIPYCTILIGECCEDTGFASTCADGAWVCDPCVLGADFCERRWVSGSGCERWARDAAPSVAEYCGLDP